MCLQAALRAAGLVAATAVGVALGNWLLEVMGSKVGRAACVLQRQGVAGHAVGRTAGADWCCTRAQGCSSSPSAHPPSKLSCAGAAGCQQLNYPPSPQMEAVTERTRSSSGLQLVVGTALASIHRPAKLLLPMYGARGLGGQGGGGTPGEAAHMPCMPPAPAQQQHPAKGAAAGLATPCHARPLSPAHTRHCLPSLLRAQGLFYSLLVVSAFADVAVTHLAQSDPNFTSTFRELFF